MARNKRTPDVNVIAATIREQATDEKHIVKNPAAVALGRLGGLKGGKARAEKLTPEMRRNIALRASWERWAKHSIYDEAKAVQIGALLLDLNDNEMDYLKFIKLLYNIERESIKRWTRPLIFDDLYSMPHGQVLSKTLDRIKPENQGVGTLLQEHIINSDNTVHLVKHTDIDKLSRAEIGLIKEMFDKYRYKTALEMREEHHTPELFPEWKDPGNSNIKTTYDDLLRVLGKTEEQTQYFKTELSRLKKLKEISQ